MALITCPECKQEISDSATTCPHCGYRLKQKKAKELQNNIGNNKLKIIIGILVAVIVIIAIVVGVRVPHGEDEQLVKIAVEEIQDSLLEPDSMEVIECYTYCLDASLEEGEDEFDLIFDAYDDQEFCYIYYKAKNKSGGYTDKSAYVWIWEGDLKIGDTEYDEKVRGNEFYIGTLYVAKYPERENIFNFTDQTANANKWIK